MTLKKEARRSLKKSKSNHKATNYNDESASATQLGHPTKECKQAKPEPESFSIKRSSLKETSLKDAEDADNPSGKLERRSSFRRKFGALLKRSTELPAVINHSLQPIRRSMSFSKDLHRSHEPSRQPYRTSSVQWYNSLSTLSSLAEDEVDADCKRAGASEVFGSRVTQVTRTHSLMEKYPTTNLRRRVNTLSHPLATPYGRHSDYYHSNIDLSNPPCEASSLPALSRVAIDAYDNETKLSLREQHVRNGPGNFRSSVRKLSPLGNFIKQHLVRSRSLTQLDSLSGSMLDTGEHHLEGDPSQQQPPHLHHHQQSHQLQHHPLGIECNRIRFLAPNATPTEIANSNRRHKFSRSQVSSNEYFSVSFEVGDDVLTSFDREEFLPATRGTYLVDVLSPACERRGVDLSRVEVLDSSSTPLSLLTTDAATLGGKHLRVIVKDERLNSRTPSQRGNQNVLLRKASGNYRSRSGRFFSVSTEDTNVDSEVGTTVSSGRSSAGLKASKQRWSGFFTNTKGIKMDLLTAQLDEYNKHGVPKLANVHLQCDVTINEEALYNLEGDWRDIVENSQMLSEKHTQQQTALWELAETEVAYIKTLKVVTNLFMACLCSLQASNILIEVDRLKLFSNIPDIYAANRYFWTEYLLAMVNASRSNGQPLDPGHLLLGFETFEQTFAPYTRYCAEQSKCQQYCKDRLNDNQLFTAYLVWCETQKDCNRLKLMDILVMPMQRLTRYSLLLKAVYKNTENEDQRAELIHMIKSVDGFVVSVNAALRRNEEAAQLDHAASRLECYDVVETKGLDEEVEKLIKLYSNLDITTAPMPGCPKDSLRTLLREGDLKLRDAATSKMEVHVLLLTDMLLICKPSTKKMLKIIRQPYVVDRIRIHEVKEPSSLGLVYLNEYGTVSAALILSAGDPKLAKSWMDSLKQAQQQFASMKVPSLGEPVMNLASVSRQPSTLGDGDFEVEEYDNTFPRTPRGSSRASHGSSLAHSHSGSMEMEGASPGSSSFLPSYNPSRNVSVDTNEQPRASSSLSSEEGGESSSGHNHRTVHMRRSLMNKSPTPNTLSVHVPYSSLGQSLPNLTLATSPQTSTVSPTPPNSLLIVPQMTKSKDTLLSPGHRGISYPPPSPPRGALRRGFALPQSRNPPLMKTRHVNASLTQSAQVTMGSSDTEVIEERRRRIDPSQRIPSTSSIVEEKK
ncbi:PREDICTED: pleckstrin homology domain-containing family G member 5-like isoform X2 [Trachymyrmex cornetzi]|uniref:pleckstrin homology domain-containing family G member 5-like isoform X2 n=1 Tax=Trachymyrmex cornetzi TaxID=471704 RepID=UPI00084F2A4A|nr:PREDICTED: pleckstrin homology domain-containing family G member 5-like isoform X2 [Trachymyrmex cornetzi]